MRVAKTLVVSAFAACSFILCVSTQSPADTSVGLEEQSATRALDAIPAVFAIARNLEGVQIDVSADSMARGYSDLADEAAAQDQLAAALGVYGFEDYSAWAATIRTIFATYDFIRSMGKEVPVIDRALQRVLGDPGIPQDQKEGIATRLNRPDGGRSWSDGVAPSEENLVVVIGLLPQIEATIEMMRAME